MLELNYMSKNKNILIQYLRSEGKFKGFKHRRHRTKNKKNSPVKLKVEKLHEESLIKEIKNVEL